jgi:hypothetical protein
VAVEPCAPMYPSEAHLGWVRVLAHEGEDAPPSTDFQNQISSKADGIAINFGFSERSRGNVIATSPASSW